jgi:methyl-accepting chemotaxis protein
MPRNLLQFKSIKTKITIWIGAIILLLATVISVYSVVTIRTNAIETAQEKVVELSKEYANTYKRELEYALTVAKSLAQTFTINTINSDERISRDYANEILTRSLADNPGIYAVYVAFEPNAFDGMDSDFINDKSTGSDSKGLFVPWWYREGSGVAITPCNMYEDDMSWYTTPRDRKKEVAFDPNIWEGLGVFVVDLMVPIYSNNTFHGVLGNEIEISFFQEMANIDIYNNTGTLSLISNNGTLSASTRNDEWVGKNISTIEDLSSVITVGDIGKTISEYSNGVFKAIVPLEIGNTGTQWAVMVTVPDAEVLRESNSSMWILIILSLIGILIALSVVWYISGRIVTPIKQFVVMLKDISQGEGDLTQRVNISGKDEINEMATWFNKFIGNVQEIIRSITETTETVASASEELSAVSNQMLAGSEEMVAQSTSVASATEEMSTNITTMASAAEEMSVNANEVAGAAEETSQNMNAVSSAVEEMSVSIGQIAQDATSAREVADQASASSQKATTTMGTLSEAAKEIGNVTEVIKRIAEQTNLLALNATIEAASAGEAGKGFAVVANEIKELANQSAKAADDIATRIDGVQSNTNEAVNVISDVTEVIEKVSSTITNIAQAVEQQNAAVNDISANVVQAGTGVENIAGSISEVAKGANDVSRNSGEASKGATDVTTNISGIQAAAQETSSGAGQVNTSATDLSKMAADLQKIVGQFTI